MPKRGAQNQLTKENCLNEDDPEEAGHFEQAGAAKLIDRNIKKAKRRLPEEKNGVPSSPFSQFAGFVGQKTPTFSFQAKPSASNRINPPMDVEKEKAYSNSTKPFAKSESLFQPKSVNSLSAPSEHSKSLSGKTESDFSKVSNPVNFEKLKQLNTSFLNWIQEHMNKNMFCDFTPVCLDYVEHMKHLEKATEVSVVPDTSESATKPKLSAQPNIDFLKKSPPKNGGESFQPKTPLGVSLFAKKDDQNPVSSPPKPFSFSAVSQNTEKNKEDDDDNYVPPKSDFQPVSEDGSLYSKRCKLFFKKDGNFADKGVGTLHIKAIDEEKKQLLVRADTSTGLILLNISLTESLPTERLGKNNVLVVCVPNPAVDSEPTSVLFRVKTTEDADELLEMLLKFKSSSQC